MFVVLMLLLKELLVLPKGLVIFLKNLELVEILYFLLVVEDYLKVPI